MKLEDEKLKQYPYEDQILRIISKYSRSLSSQEISLITGIDHGRICKKLEKLQKYDLIECSTSKQVKFWRIKV